MKTRNAPKRANVPAIIRNHQSSLALLLLVAALFGCGPYLDVILDGQGRDVNVCFKIMQKDTRVLELCKHKF